MTARHLLLVGGGHSHVEVVRRFGHRPLPGTTVTLLSRDRFTPYSGMLPGYIAGHYRYRDVHIDLQALAATAGIDFVRASASGLDRDAGTVVTASGAAYPYDAVSLDIGSTPDPGETGADRHAVAAKPIDGFDARWRALLERVCADPTPRRIAVVGGGAGGVELVLAMQHRLTGELRARDADPSVLRFALYTRGTTLLPTHNPRVQRRFRRLFARRAIDLQCGQAVTGVDAHGLTTADGRHHRADEVIWVTRARGADWLANTGLALDAQGFIRVGDTLQSVTDARVFAAGDIASMDNQPRAKAGVIAVRQGPPLARNLRRFLRHQPLRPHHPQRHWLALVTTGDRHAVASRGAFSTGGRLIWHAKDWIDRRFMRRYRPARDATPGV